MAYERAIKEGGGAAVGGWVGRMKTTAAYERTINECGGWVGQIKTTIGKTGRLLRLTRGQRVLALRWVGGSYKDTVGNKTLWLTREGDGSGRTDSDSETETVTEEKREKRQ